MASVTLQGNAFHTVDDLPAVGSKVPDFSLTDGELNDKRLSDFAGKKIIFNIFPSLDTETCANSVRQFNSRAASIGSDVVILCISRDLPFAQGRFCGAEGIKNVITLSSMKDDKFGKDFGVAFSSGPLAGLFSRSVIVTDADGTIKYTQQVSETVDEPDYAKALAAL